MKACRIHQTASGIFQLIAAAILFQTLFFKFTGAAESKHIFTVLGVEPWGRIGLGMVELVAVALLVTHRYAVHGALLSLGVMSGALLSHLTGLGVVVQDDGGLLFALAVTVFGASAIVVWLRRFQIPHIGPLLSTTQHADDDGPGGRS